MASVNPADINIRPATASDEHFLKDLHDQNRLWEFAPVKKSDPELYGRIMKQQYDAHHSQYFDLYDIAKYGIIQWTNIPIGRIYVDYRDNEVRILQIGVLPDYQGKGIASIVLRGLCVDAAFRKLPVRLFVHPLNQAHRLYQELGFVATGYHAGPSIELEWFHPDPEQIMRGKFLPPKPIVGA